MTGPEDPNWRWEFRCEDFVYARLADDQTGADTMPPGSAREAELNRIDSLYLIADQHNIWIDARGRSHAVCVTCGGAAGVPCTTMCGLARLWRTHPDYVPAWNQSIDNPRYRGNVHASYAKRTTIYQERKAELDAFYDRFDLEQADGGERWRCKACSAHGDTWKTIPGAYDYPHAMGTAQHQHPTCEKTALENTEPTT
jgi:rubrerythrin